MISMFPIRKGKKIKAKHETTMIGNAMYRPTSNASVLSAAFPPPGTTPPRVAALISSSDASQDFIFSSKLVALLSVAIDSNESNSPSAIGSGKNLPVVVDDNENDDVGEKACETCSIAAINRRKRVMVNV